MNKFRQSQPNDRLRNERLQRQWTQQMLADHIGVTAITVNRWERGVTAPGAFFRLKLCSLFGKSATELGFLSAESARPFDRKQLSSPAIVHLPLRRNPWFTGRQSELTHLHHALHQAQGVAQSISGLGGMGKTQIALEYAYRFQHEYRTIFWLRAETFEVLLSDAILLAERLHLYHSEEQDQNHTLALIRDWLRQQTDWLLILDNIEQFALLEEVIPVTVTGHVLLTTRLQSVGTWAQQLILQPMPEEDGMLLLLRRAKLLVPGACLTVASEEMVNAARSIMHVLDGLPLALDQAGAYIEETGCRVSDYLKTYHIRQGTLLQQRGTSSVDHHQSVATTFSLCLERVAQVNAYAIEVLQFCAFLAADAIPEELISSAGPASGSSVQSSVADSFAFDEALAVLRMASLVQRNAETRTLTLHRLLQTIIKGSLSEKEQRAWSQRILHALASVFPTGEQITLWSRCEQLIPHVQIAFDLAEQWNIVSHETGLLFEHAGVYLCEHGRYGLAESLLVKAQSTLSQVGGSNHPATIHSLHSLASLYLHQGRYAETERLLQDVLTFQEHHLDRTHLDTREILNDLAVLYLHQGRYEEAEPLFYRILAMWEQEGRVGPELASILNNLGLLTLYQGRYHIAEPLLQRTLTIWEQQHDPHPGYVVHALDNLAILYARQGRYHEAEPLHLRALQLQEDTMGPMHPDTARLLSNLAFLYRQQGRYHEAEPLYQRSLIIREQQLGTHHLETAISLNGLAALYLQQGQYSEAESFFHRALAIREQQLGADHPDVAKCLIGLAALYEQQQQYSEAELLLERSLTIRTRCLGVDHPETQAIAERYASVKATIRTSR